MVKKQLKFLSLWAINDKLEAVSLKAQLDELQAAGLEGVIFHPRFYPGIPVYMSKQYLDIVSEVILYAKQIGMTFWIYDENGWPSGTASGQVIARNPHLVCQWLEFQPAEASEPLGTPGRVIIQSKSAVSSLDPEATTIFIELTHDAYRKGLAPEAFDYVTGFFSDEVAFLDGHGITFQKGGIPWSDRFPEQYEERYGEHLHSKLSFLFEEGEEASVVRTRYWEMLTDAIREGFYKPIADWCDVNGKLFTAHLKAEENPFFQLMYSGSGFQVLQDVSIPALDALERFPGNNYYPRMVHSVSVQQGRESTLVEAMGGAGWGASPESFTDYVLWLASHGVDQYVMHLSQYKLKMQALQDWPPSIPCHLTWKDAFPSIISRIKERAAGSPDLREGKPELLIVTPTRGVMSSFLPFDAMVINEHDGSGVPDSVSGSISNRFIELIELFYAAGIHYELTEERVLEEAAVLGNGKVWIGQREYSKVLLPNGCLWQAGVAGALSFDECMRKAGVEVFGEQDLDQLLGLHGSATRSVTDDTVTEIAVIQSEWEVEQPEINQLLIEVFPTPETGKLAGVFVLENGQVLHDLKLVMLDQVRSVRLNGCLLDHIEIGGRYQYRIPEAAWTAGNKGIQRIEIEPVVDLEQNYVIFLQGRFQVFSRSAYSSKDDRQLATSGPFVVAAAQSLQGVDFIEEGLPFCFLPVKATKIIELQHDVPYATVKLIGIAGDAVQLYVNDTEIGWAWGPDFSAELPEGLKAGAHRVTAKVVPSTYNSYGPHRYYEGDRHLISPNQYSGIKNFADRMDAPEMTLGKEWHFVKWHINGEIQLSK